MINRIRETLTPWSMPSKKNIVIIEDNEISLRLIELTISRNFSDLEIIKCKTPEQALQYICKIKSGSAQCPSVAIIDRNLGSVMGDEFSVLLKSVCPRVKTILYSGTIQWGEIEREMKAFKIDKVIEKNGNMEGILSFIRSSTGSEIGT